MPEKFPRHLYWRNNGKTLWGRFKIGGVEYRRSLRTDDLGEAKTRFAAWKAAIERQGFDIEETHTFREAALRWGKEVLPQSVKPSVVRRYLTSLAVLDPVFGKLALHAITGRTISNYVSRRSGAVSNSTIRRDLTALSRMLAACVSWGWLTDNPARTFDRSIIRQRSHALTIPTDAELAVVLALAPAGMTPILRLLAETGMRENEAVTLERSNVDRERRQITVTLTKNGRPRSLNWTTPGGDAGLVLAALPPIAATPFLFPNRDGVPYASFSGDYGNLIRRAVAQEAKADRPFRRFRAHDLRHRFAIRWLKAGGDIYRLSRHLGHTSVRTTESYLRYLTDDEIDVIRGVTKIDLRHSTQNSGL